MQVREEIDDRVAVSDAGVYELNRANLYLLLRMSPTENYSISGAVYYQPATSDFDDYRMLFDAAIKSKLTTKLSLSFSYEYSQDSKPPQDVQSVDTGLKASLVYSF